jgi:hypothetical protein
MANETLEFDASGSNVDGTSPGSALVIMSAAANYLVTAFSAPSPPPKVQWASSIDTDGSLRVDPNNYENRTVTLTVETLDSSSSSTHESALRGKLTKLHREGGTLKWTRKDTSVRIFDVLAVDFVPVTDHKYEQGRAEFQITLTCLPAMRGAEQDLGDNTETTLPALVFTEASVPGEFDALGRLVIDNDDATNNQWWVVWGIESRHYSSSANAALFYEAEGRTAMGGSATAAGPSGASGGGSNVMRNTGLTTAYQAILSTQATGGGAHLSHVGTFRVFARVQAPTTNTSAVSVAMEWGSGDFRRFTENATTVLSTDWEGTWRIVDLGLVTLPKVISGTQQWEGRVLAKSSTAGDDLDVDWLLIVPVGEGSGEASALSRQPSPTAFSARDEFDQAAGALTGETLPIGGTWTGAGDADDFSNTGTTATRTAVSDSSTLTGGRYITASTPTLANSVVQFAFPSHSNILGVAAGGITSGAIARYVDVNNWVMAQAYYDSPTDCGLRVVKRVSGTATVIATLSLNLTEFNAVADGAYVRFTVDASGSFSAWLLESSEAPGTPDLTGYDAVLATGGTLDDGKVGLYDAQSNATANTRTYTEFWASTYVSDAAIFASQSLEIRHDGVRREDSAGALWAPPSKYEGDYLRVPASGAEAWTVRMVVKASRNVPGLGPDSGIDDISARLFVTPRYL